MFEFTAVPTGAGSITEASALVWRIPHRSCLLPIRAKPGGLNPCRLARARQAVFRQSGSPMAGSPFSGGSGPTAQRPHIQRIHTGRGDFSLGARPN